MESDGTRRRGLYLKVGEHVIHKEFPSWGRGVVIEEWTSEVPGGACFVKIIFQDGKVRIFNNDFYSEFCCYYKGIRRI